MELRVFFGENVLFFMEYMEVIDDIVLFSVIEKLLMWCGFDWDVLFKKKRFLLYVLIKLIKYM